MADSGDVFALCIVVGLVTSVGSLASRWLIVPSLLAAAAWAVGALASETRFSAPLVACAALPLAAWLLSLWARRQVRSQWPAVPRGARSRSRA